MSKTKILLAFMSAFFLFASIGITFLNYNESSIAILLYGTLAGACVAFFVTEPNTKDKRITKQGEQ
jgi:hypothetical protein